MASPNQQYQKPSKKSAPPMEQAPPPAPVTTVSQDQLSQSGYSAAWTSISQRQQPAPSTVASTAAGGGSTCGKPFNVMDELEQRKSWAVGTVIEVFSASATKWYIAQLVQVGE